VDGKGADVGPRRLARTIGAAVDTAGETREYCRKPALERSFKEAPATELGRQRRFGAFASAKKVTGLLRIWKQI
jgi:hypothetical protein